MIHPPVIDELLEDARTSDRAYELTEVFFVIFEELIRLDRDEEKIMRLLEETRRSLRGLQELADSIGLGVVYEEEGKVGNDVYNYLIYQISKDVYGKKLQE